MKKLILLCMLTLMLVGCQNLTYVRSENQGVLLIKNYEEEHRRMIMVGKMLSSRTVPDRFEFIIEYDNTRHRFDVDKETYDSVEVGESVALNVNRGYNEEGALKRQYVSLK